MNKPILFNRTRKSIARKLSNPIYVDIINSHDITLIADNFTLLELIFIAKALKKIDSMSEEELKELYRE